MLRQKNKSETQNEGIERTSIRQMFKASGCGADSPTTSLSDSMDAEFSEPFT